MSSKKSNLLAKNQTPQKWKFSDIIAIPGINEKWEKVRKYFFLRESTYDMTNRCNLQCEGCYYYKGDKSIAKENTDPQQWQRLMIDEKKRGITYVVLAGAEPSLVPELCETCFREIPYGCIATNGLKRIPESIDYQIHISVWGNDQTSLKTRNAKNMLRRQMDNYKNDPRAVFVYTFTSKNIDEIHEVMDFIADNGGMLTFNMFSSPVGYDGELRHNDISLIKTRKTMQQICSTYPENIYFSNYNIVSHTHKLGLHDLFYCSYPRMNQSKDIGLGRSFRQYRTDLTWDRSMSCCVPDTDCADCRHYAAGSAVVTARMYRHAVNPDLFSAWLDYVDVYLSVWVRGYEKEMNLCTDLIAPPGHEIFEH
ncbi:MAG: radical SAM protein [Desulfobacterales bacterium CG23_combo_of_CG06-09_8_20_14_all_51_8]|nr:MAG: radical SAM protein [Desulfobacterales bacterium CG23_combo_of_CG06-09_8_20_14_all_51_8]